MFHWKAQGLAIKSKLEVVEPCQEIGWTGISIGMRAEHLWHFEATADGTKVRTEESLSGWLTRFLALFDRQFLEKSMANSLAMLKEQAEKAV